MAIIRTVKRDLEAASHGQWFDFDLVPGIRFRIAHKDARFEKRLHELVASFRGAWEAGKVPEEKRREVIGRAMSETVLTGWEGFEDLDDKGNAIAIPYTPEKAFEYLASEAYVEMREWIWRRAGADGAFREKLREDSLGNSLSSSSGSSSTDKTSASVST